MPNLPDYPGFDRFEGTSHHSNAHPDGERYRGKRHCDIAAATYTSRATTC